MVKEKDKAEQFPLREACKWLFWSALIGPIPVWVLFFFLHAFSRVPTLSQFADKGEFAIYSASIFASAMYLLSKDEKTPAIKGRSVFGPLCVLGLIVAILSYAAVTVSIFGEITPNLVFIQKFTLILFGAAITIGFLITGFDVVRSYPDPMPLFKDGEKRLEDAFENSGGSR